MKAGGMMILGGLLKGAGQGLTNIHEERRQEALIALKRSQDLEDANTKRTQQLEDNTTEFGQKKELLGAAADADVRKTEEAGRQQRMTRAVDYGYDVALEGVKTGNTVKVETIKAGLDMKKDAASKAASAQIDGGQVQSTRVGANGELILVYKDGKAKIAPGVTVALPGSGDEGEEEGGTIAGAAARRGGAAPAPAAKPKTVLTGEEQNRARSFYANATPTSAPFLFQNGKKIPLAMYEAMVNGRLGK